MGNFVGTHGPCVHVPGWDNSLTVRRTHEPCVPTPSGCSVEVRFAEVRAGEPGVCHNIEVVGAAASGVWRAVRRGVKVCETGVMPLWHVVEDEYVCLYRNCLVVTDLRDGLTQTLMPLEGVMPLSGVYRDGWLRVWFEDGSERLWYRYDNVSYEARDEEFYAGRERYGVFEIVAGRRTEYVARIGECALTGDYGRAGSVVCPGDRAALKRDMVAAHEEIYAKARAEGYYVQPVLVRYRLEDESGETLYVSQPKVVGCESGFGGLDVLSMRTEGGMTSRCGCEVRMEGYKLAVRMCGDVSECEGVARLVVEVSEPLEPVARECGVICSVERGSAGGEGTLRAQFAQKSVRDVVMGRVSEMLCNGGKSVVEFVLGPAGLPDDDGEGYAEMWPAGKASHPMSGVCGRYGLPHQFVPLSVRVEGDAVPVIGAGYMAGLPGSAAWLGVCRRAKSGSWRGYVSVTMADGSERVVEASSGTGGAPEVFGPLWMYGSADAVTMTVCVSAGGETRRRTVALQSVPGADAAAWLSEGGKPVRLEEEVEVFALPAMRRELHTERGALVSARIGERGRLTAVDVRRGIEAIAGAEAIGFTRTGSVWSRMTSRFVLSGASGTLMASIASDGRLTGVRMLSDTGLRSLCRLGNGRVFGLTAANELAEVCEREVKLTGMEVEDATVCAADRGTERVVIADVAGLLWEYEPVSGCYHTRDVNGEGCLHVTEVASSGCVAAWCESGVYRLDGEPGDQYIRHVEAIDTCGAMIDEVAVDLSGVVFDGSLSVGVSQGSRGMFETVGRVSPAGECMSRVRAWLPLMRCRRVQVSLVGRVSD